MGECQACGFKGTTQKHHVLYDPEFIVELCPTCHARAHFQNSESYEAILRRYEMGRELFERIKSIRHGEKLSFIKKQRVMKSELYRYMKLFNKFPTVKKLKEFLKEHPCISWHHLTSNYL